MNFILFFFAVHLRRVRRTHYRRRRRAALGDLLEGFGGRSRVHSDQEVRSGRVVSRNGQRRVERNVLEQIAEQAQPIVHEGGADAGRPGGGHRQGKCLYKFISNVGEPF